MKNRKPMSADTLYRIFIFVEMCIRDRLFCLSPF